MTLVTEEVCIGCYPCPSVQLARFGRCRGKQDHLLISGCGVPAP